MNFFQKLNAYSIQEPQENFIYNLKKTIKTLQQKSECDYNTLDVLYLILDSFGINKTNDIFKKLTLKELNFIHVKTKEEIDYKNKSFGKSIIKSIFLDTIKKDLLLQIETIKDIKELEKITKTKKQKKIKI